MATQKQLDDLKIAISNKSPLAAALIEDENVRYESANRSKAYLQAKDEHEETTPFWMWCALWYALGMLTVISIDVSITGLIHTGLEWLNKVIGG